MSRLPAITMLGALLVLVLPSFGYDMSLPPSLTMRVPFRVALIIPPDDEDGNHALLEVSQLQSLLTAILPRHNATFFDGYDYTTSRLGFNIDWKVSVLPPAVLREYEDRLLPQYLADKRTQPSSPSLGTLPWHPPLLTPPW